VDIGQKVELGQRILILQEGRIMKKKRRERE
jgi:hypothetical protein